jgi:restriction system protein
VEAAFVNIPDYQSLMWPLLVGLSDGREHQVRDLRESIAAKLGLGAPEREALLPSGKQPIFDNRLGWAKTYLTKAGLVSSVRRGVVQLTERGRSVLASKPPALDVDYLAQFSEFEEFRRKGEGEAEDEAGTVTASSASAAPGTLVPPSSTPQESLDAAYNQLRRAVEAELLAAVRASSFRFFERLVVELLVKMGYGGSLKDAGKAIGRSGDDGLDGVIKEDHLGLDAIYVQAKRWENKVGRPEVQAFAGSLEGVRGRKGVFITTSTFSNEAREYVSRIEKKIVLVDGRQLASLMVDFGIGVAPVNTYEVKRVDSDYFFEE